jgi:alpha-methylacyl-CoA racemase
MDATRGSPLRPLAGVRIVSTALNLPGPLALARGATLGASVIKVEPHTGDPLAIYAPEWYGELHAGVDVQRLDLKTAGGQAAFKHLLAGAHVLLTSQRPSALVRLGLDSDCLMREFPHLDHIAIVGSAAAPEQAGHDLTYMVDAGLVHPGINPATLFADIAGAEQVLTTLLASQLVKRAAAPSPLRLTVGLADSAQRLAAARHHGLTGRGSLLGGELPTYRSYPTRDGWIALAALEPKFVESLKTALAVSALTADNLGAHFQGMTTAEAVAWGAALDLPLTAFPLT